MLKFVGTLRNGSSRAGSRSWGVSNHPIISASANITTTSQVKSEKPAVNKLESPKQSEKPSMSPKVKLFFDSLKKDQDLRVKFNKNASTTINELLNIAEMPNISRNAATSTVATLKELSESGKFSLKDIEQDSRYKKLCSMIKPSSPPITMSSKNPLFATSTSEFNEFAHDTRVPTAEAVRIMSALAVKHRRITPVLKNLTAIIYKSKEILSIKQIADVLYGMAVLNYPNELLLQKLCGDIISNSDAVKQSPIMGSILTSLGMLRYRDSAVIDKLSEWMVQHKGVLRTQDLCALIMTLGVVNYTPVNVDSLFQELIEPLRETDMIRSSEWLDVVWALTVLNRVQPKQLESVLNKKFVDELGGDGGISHVKRMKLMNVNAAAQLLMKNYSGSLLDDEFLTSDVPMTKTRDKEIFVKSITDALANLFPSREYFQANVDIGTGFVLDVEFFLNKNGTPVPTNKVFLQPNALRIGIVANYYYDYCLGEKEVLGPVDLHCRLLDAKDYKILKISHTDFRTDDKLLKRITYINDYIKSIVK